MAGHTKDRLYESNDSREMLNGSFSFKTFRWLCDDLVELLDFSDQKLLVSPGDGGR